MPFSDQLFSPDYEYIAGEFSTTYDEIRNFMDAVEGTTEGIGNLALKVCTLGAFRTFGPEGDEDPSHWDGNGEFDPNDFVSPSQFIEPHPGTVEAAYTFMLRGDSKPPLTEHGRNQRGVMELADGRLILWGNGNSRIGHLNGMLKRDGHAVKRQNLRLTRVEQETLESNNPDHFVYRSGLVPLGRIAVPRLR